MTNKITENDNVETDIIENQDHDFDSLDDAVDALADDDYSDEEQTDIESEEDLTEETEEQTDADLTEDLEDDVQVTLADGETVTLSELKDGHFRQKDYTHKTEALANERKAFESQQQEFATQTQSLQAAYQQLETFLGSLIPPEPDISLAQVNPAEYNAQLALRNSAIAEVQQIQAASQHTNGMVQQFNEADVARYKQGEDAKLLEVMPSLKDPAKRVAFDSANKKTALEFGFTEQEIESTADHRILQVMHYAALGKIAERNRQNAKRRIAERPNKGKKAAPAKAATAKSNNAVKRLNQTGSIDDAMNIDFD